MVERFNGRVEEVLQSHHFRSGEELETTLHRYVCLYNQQLPQSALGCKAPLQAMKDWHKFKPNPFRKLQAIRDTERAGAHQMALFDEQARPTWDPRCVVRFDDTVYQNVPTQPLGALRFRKHLLGADRAPLLDGDLNGEEFQCAWSLDSLEDVSVWVRNVAKHPDSFWLPRVGSRFYPDFVAKLGDGRVFVVEYKGEHLVDAPEAREQDLIGKIWARTTGNVFLMVRKVAHGSDMGAQMRHSLRV